ncbi:ATPase [Thermococcus litoralis DSM 5473]|uniref:ATPase n=1 Tax=Thermococcus litoralis (strain ATCC 51850 / DSM 5473 / JCM 8560 / NS-C) TaxID=523849 RepID=H3ZQS3_THELN|nr:ATPase [Thermococcus litoralis]EHR77649.1 ATPase [Thermococcus litoralis DSM 5473]
MRLILKPLFEAPLTPDFIEVIKTKLKGKEVREGDVLEIDLLGKPLKFKVIYAEPEVIKVTDLTAIELSKEEIFSTTLEFEKEIKDLLLGESIIAVVFDDEVLILNQRGHKIFNQKFEKLKEVRVTKNTVLVIHNENKLTIIQV